MKLTETSYFPYVNKWGKITNTIGILFAFFPLIAFGVFYGYWPKVPDVMLGWMNITAAFGSYYVMQPIQFFPILGVAGTYMSNLSGNIMNMRVPCSIAAEKAAGVEAGTQEAEICATIGSAVSTLINIVILTLAVIAGVSVLNMLPKSMVASLQYLLPALLGACTVLVSFDNPVFIPIALAVTFAVKLGLVGMFPGLAVLGDVIAIFGTVAVGFFLYKAGIIYRKK
ncbi:MAG: hypothetical protein SOZ52_01880 [Pyramidobacter sp.]|nr:hypothetical protein [Pyramidobacter sp.]